MKPIILTLLLLTILLGRPAVGGEIQNAARAGDLDKVKALLADKPELKKCFALGEKVVVCLDAQNAIAVE